MSEANADKRDNVSPVKWYKKSNYIGCLVTLVAAAFTVVRWMWPNVTIDGVSVALFVIAIIPWLAPVFESIELPGGWKVKFQAVQKQAERAEIAAQSAAGTAE